MKNIGHWINGEHVLSATPNTSPVFNPATGAEQALLQLATAEQVNDVVAAAHSAFKFWGNSSLSQRAKTLFAFREIVNRRVNELAAAITDEHGKVLSDAAGEVQRGLEVV